MRNFASLCLCVCMVLCPLFSFFLAGSGEGWKGFLLSVATRPLTFPLDDTFFHSFSFSCSLPFSLSFPSTDSYFYSHLCLILLPPLTLLPVRTKARTDLSISSSFSLSLLKSLLFSPLLSSLSSSPLLLLLLSTHTHQQILNVMTCTS